MADFEESLKKIKQYNLKNQQTNGNNDRLAREEQELAFKASQKSRYDSDTKDRIWLSQWATAVVTVWLMMVLMILSFNSNCLKLNDSVLIMLLGTTTLNVLGLSYIVLKGLFGNNNSN